MWLVGTATVTTQGLPALTTRRTKSGDFNWPKLGTQTWPPVGTFSWPRTYEAWCRSLGGYPVPPTSRALPVRAETYNPKCLHADGSPVEVPKTHGGPWEYDPPDPPDRDPQ